MQYVYVKHGDAVNQVRRICASEEIDGSGPDAFIGDFLRRRDEDDVLVLCYSDRPEDFSCGRIRALGIAGAGARRGGLSVYRRLRAALQVYRRIIQWRPDRILCGCTGDLLWASVAAAKWLGVPVVNARHGELKSRGSLAGLLSWLDRSCIRACDAVVCHGPFMADQMREIGISSSRIGIFEVDLRGFASAAHSGTDLETFLDFTTHRASVFTFVGRIQRNKGVFDLLGAFSSLRARFPEVGLVYVGDGADLPELKARVARERLSDDVLLLGRLEHNSLPAVIRSSIAIVAPTRPELGEGRCMAVLEALCLGTPAVGPESTAFPYAIEHEQNGLLFEAGSQAALLAALERLLSDSRLLAHLREGASSSSQSLLSKQVSFGEAVDAAFGDTIQGVGAEPTALRN